MNTQEVANKLVALCRIGQFQQAQSELYADDCISIESGDSPDAITKGLPAIKAKIEQWSSSVQEVHDAQISDPIAIGNHFAITHMVDCTFKEGGRQKVEEISVYEVRDGKV
ncbi:MAG: nuclear transport factor 2 family protein, partial [Bacteroidetes bacterium]|nr:nuclear transport factor 2 family protein [Bacteroidota bacterium]